MMNLFFSARVLVFFNPFRHLNEVLAHYWVCFGASRGIFFSHNSRKNVNSICKIALGFLFPTRKRHVLVKIITSRDKYSLSIHGSNALQMNSHLN